MIDMRVVADNKRVCPNKKGVKKGLHILKVLLIV